MPKNIFQMRGGKSVTEGEGEKVYCLFRKGGCVLNAIIQESREGTMPNPMLVGGTLKEGKVPEKRNRIISETHSAPLPSLTSSAVGHPHDEQEEERTQAKKLGIKIREVRTDAGESMDEFRKKIGVSASAVYKWEAGLSEIRESKLKELCSVYHVNEDWMLGKDMPKVPESLEHMKTREMLNHAMMFLDDKELLKTELFIADILEKPLHTGVVKDYEMEASL